MNPCLCYERGAVFEGFYSIYDKKVCERTLEYIKPNDEIVFSWDIEKQWINEILNDLLKDIYNQNIKNTKVSIDVNPNSMV